MSAEAIKKAQGFSDEFKKAQGEARERPEKVIEAEDQAVFNYTRAFSNLSLHISEIISASYSPRNL